jgi:prepilin-type N-terminal cleavage/methylation domain-containing protein
MRSSRGFTLIETIVVILVVAVLSGISYFSYQQLIVRAKEAPQEVILSTFMTDAQAIWIADRANQDWTLALTRAARDLPDDENWTFRITSDPSANSNDIVADIRGTTVGLAISNDSGTCYGLIQGGQALKQTCRETDSSSLGGLEDGKAADAKTVLGGGATP